MGRMKNLGVLIAVAVAITAADVHVARGQQLDTAAVRIILEQHLGRRVSQQEILAHLRRSGMSRDEARAQLRARGYDPAVADQYYDQLEAGAGGPVAADVAFVRALERIGLARPQGGPEAEPHALAVRETQPPAEAAPADPSRAPQDSAARGAERDSLPHFGRNLFARSDTEFEPVLVGPAPLDYRLGPGDQIVLVLTGDVQDAYEITVSGSGNLVIPNAGQIAVNGLTLAQLEDQLYDRLGSVYAGVQRGAEATTRFSVSLGNLRTIQIYIVGEVARPGAVTVSSMATVFNALYHAGGPNEDGSFRYIQVRRGGRVVQEVDLYDYLVYGDGRSDIRLEHGDRIHVPLARTRVTVKGEIVRPAIYEVREGEGLRDVIEYAGGLEPDAFLRSVQIDRILPPGARQSGVERVIHNVNIEALSGEAEPIALNAGDVIEVFAVSEERRHRVTISGEVRRPGTYAWQEGTTLWGLIGQAEGLSERAYTRRAHVYRLNEADGSRQLIRTPLLTGGGGTPVGDVGLADADSVVIFSRERLRNPAVVSIDGLVKQPGSFPLAEGMTLQDLILSAGGFEEGANVLEAEVARLPEGLARLDTTAYVVRVPLPPAGGPEDDAQDDAAAEALSLELARRPDPGEVPAWRPVADEFELRHGDRVFVRRAPGYEPTRMVAVTGEVMLPGAYALETRRERLLSVLDRTGGLTEQAYPDGLRVVREGKVVAIEVMRARAEPSSGHNIVLEAGDSIHVPAYDPTVIVAGAVNFESRVLYQPGEGLDYYVSQSGGYRDDADAGRVTITYQNGAREDIDKFLIFSSKPTPTPGSTIFVPFKPEAERQGLNVDQFLSRMTAIVSTLVAVIVATR